MTLYYTILNDNKLLATDLSQKYGNTKINSEMDRRIELK